MHTKKPIQELKNCPFCGGKSNTIRTVLNYVECYKCGASGPLSAKTDNSISRWNTRSGGWQDIDENTPRDGTHIMLLFPGFKFKAIEGLWDGQQFRVSTTGISNSCVPTHWMPTTPLPAPPEAVTSDSVIARAEAILYDTPEGK